MQKKTEKKVLINTHSVRPTVFDSLSPPTPGMLVTSRIHRQMNLVSIFIRSHEQKYISQSHVIHAKKTSAKMNFTNMFYFMENFLVSQLPNGSKRL